jgi:hypothetical protein
MKEVVIDAESSLELEHALCEREKMSECIEYDVKYLWHCEIKGKLLLFLDKVVFEPNEEEEEEIEIPVSKIKDARLATEKDISALRVFLLGPVWGVFFKKEHKLLIIDVEDELGIIKHLAFEGDGMEEAVEDLYDIRRKEKMGLAKPAEPVIKRKLRHGDWQCKRCMRINAANAKFCTKCGKWRA